MSEPVVDYADDPEETVVRQYLTALSNGRVLDALNAFSLDASLRDETGRERRGIREIAAAFARGDRPIKVEIEELTREGDAVAVQARMAFPGSSSPKTYRSVFRVRRDRIESVAVHPLPAKMAPRRRFAART